MSTANATSVTVRFDPTANSQQADIIQAATSQNAGVMTAAQVAELAAASAAVAVPAGTIDIFSPSGLNGTLRPAATAVGAIAGSKAVIIVNADSKGLNYSDGVNWYDFDGNLA